MSIDLKNAIKMLSLTVLKKEISDFNKVVKINGYSKLKRNEIEKLILKHSDNFQHLILKAKEISKPKEKKEVEKPKEKKEVEKPKEKKEVKKPKEKKEVKKPKEKNYEEMKKEMADRSLFLNYRELIFNLDEKYGLYGSKLGLEYSDEYLRNYLRYNFLNEKANSEKDGENKKATEKKIKEMENTDLKIQKKIKIDDKIYNIVHYNSDKHSKLPNIGIVIDDYDSKYKILKVDSNIIAEYNDGKKTHKAEGYIFPDNIDTKLIITVPKDKTKPFYIYEKVFKSDIDVNL
jgi:hypothetical protein